MVMPQALMSTHLLWDGDEARLQLRGEAAFATGHVITASAQAVLAQRPRVLIIDMSRVTYCDSTGFQVLIQAARAAQAVDCEFAVVEPNRLVLQNIEILGLRQLFNIAERP
nr:hypothetical protein [uncultured bacterium]